MLHEIGRGIPVAQVAQPVQAHARRQAPVKLGFGGGIGRGGAGLGNTPGERAVVERGETRILGHKASIATISADV